MKLRMKTEGTKSSLDPHICLDELGVVCFYYGTLYSVVN